MPIAIGSYAFSVAALLVLSLPAGAQITAPEAACRSKLTSQLGKGIKAGQKAIAGCHRSRHAGEDIR